MNYTGFLMLAVIGLSFPKPAGAQCAPTVQQLITERKFDEARAEVDALLKRSPRDDAAMDCMGRVLLEKGKPGDAAEWLEKATKINPQSGQHFLWLAKALGAEGERQASFGSLSSSAGSNPPTSGLWRSTPLLSMRGATSSCSTRWRPGSWAVT